jgi:hypothetical protein
MMSLRQDLPDAIRLWLRSPGLTLAVLASLTLSLGAATAVFTFVDALLLRPLPVRAPNELFAVGSTTGDLNLNPRYFSMEFYRDLTQRDPAFTDLIASSVAVSSGVNLSADGSAARLRGELVSGNYFRALGVSAQAGPTISDADDLPSGASPVVVLSDAAWRRRFNGRSDAVGQVVRLNDHPYTIVGVASPVFFGTRPGFNPDLWIPMGMLMLRMRSGSATTENESRLTTAYQAWIRTTSTDAAPPAALRLVSAARGLSLLRGQFGKPVTILMSAVVILLAIACANVANLLLSRGMASGDGDSPVAGRHTSAARASTHHRMPSACHRCWQPGLVDGCRY